MLSLLGGIFVILGGLTVLSLASLSASYGFIFFGFGGAGLVYGAIGVLLGSLIVASSVLLRSRPDDHIAWGVVVFVLSILSWFGAFGGFFVGFLLGLIGGILAMVWQPRAPIGVPTMGPAGAPMARPPTTSSSGTLPWAQTMTPVLCPRCGQPSSYIPQFSRYYCYRDQQYV